MGGKRNAGDQAQDDQDMTAQAEREAAEKAAAEQAEREAAEKAAAEQADREAAEKAAAEQAAREAAEKAAAEQADREAAEKAAAEQAAREAAEKAARKPRDPAAHVAAVRLVMAAFGAALPAAANSSGHYLAPEDSLVNPAIQWDGKFRVIGSDWAGRFEGGRLVEAFRCVPPHFGGDDINIIN